MTKIDGESAINQPDTFNPVLLIAGISQDGVVYRTNIHGEPQEPRLGDRVTNTCVRVRSDIWERGWDLDYLPTETPQAVREQIAVIVVREKLDWTKFFVKLDAPAQSTQQEPVRTVPAIHLAGTGIFGKNLYRIHGGRAFYSEVTIKDGGSSCYLVRVTATASGNIRIYRRWVKPDTMIDIMFEVGGLEHLD